MSLIRFKKDPLPTPLFPSFANRVRHRAFPIREEVKRILFLSLSLVERDDNSTCVNSFQSKKNKRKAKKREDRESISRVKSSEVYEGGGKKNIFRVIARDCFLSSSKPHPCETILSNRIESKLRNKCCETSWLFETLSTSGN